MEGQSRLEPIRRPRRDPARGLYRPEDTLWKVNSELLLMLGGVRSVLLEIAHPLVAAGVAQHSSFRTKPLKRLFGTLRTFILLTFGDARMTQIGARHTNQCHVAVHGEIAESVGTTPAGSHYDADDPVLRLWVFATVVDSNLLVHDLFVRPLSPAEKIAYYEDSKRMARILGIPASVMPCTYADFQVYMRQMLDGDVLRVGEDGRAVLKGLFGGFPLGPLVRLSSYAGIGLLPERIRAEFGLGWSARDERFLGWLEGASRRLRRILPDVLCTFPAASYYAARYHSLNDEFYE